MSYIDKLLQGKESEIPPFSRNDGSAKGDPGGDLGGDAAQISTPLPKGDRHSERSEETIRDKDYSN